MYRIAGSAQVAPEPLAIEAPDVPWYACYTRARTEKRVDLHFRMRGIESYLPVAPLERKWRDRVKRIDWPLFPSYVFVRLPGAGVSSVLTTPGVTSVVYVNGRPAPIADAEIRNIARFAAGLAVSGVEPPRVQFQAGEAVLIVDGSFAGVEGVVLETRGRRRVVVGLRTLGVGFELNVPVRSLERVGGRSRPAAAVLA